MQEARCHMISVGAEAGSQEQQKNIKKNINVGHFEYSLRQMNDRGITTGCSWIIGYPGETEESMMETIRVAAEMKYRFPRSASDIFPFRPIPGTEDFDKSVGMGYQPPVSLEDWGGCLEYKLEIDDLQLPDDVVQTWKRYGVASTFYDGLAMEGAETIRKAMKWISGWRLKRNRYSFPLEQKLFHMYVRLTKPQGKRAVTTDPQLDRTPGVTPSAPV